MNTSEQNGKPRVEIVLAITTMQYAKTTVDSLIMCASARIFAGSAIVDCCLLPQGRNKCVRMAYENNPNFTHMLFVDDDMAGFGPEHILKLVADDVDVISALVTARKPPYQIVNSLSSSYLDKEIWEMIGRGDVVETELVGSAFTLIKREVLDATREMTGDGPVWYTMDREPRESFEVEVEDYIRECINKKGSRAAMIRDAIEFGQSSHIGTNILGEDISFGRRIQQAGFKMWVDCGVSVGHIGHVAFDFRHAFAEASANEKDRTDSSIVNDDGLCGDEVGTGSKVETRGSLVG